MTTKTVLDDILDELVGNLPDEATPRDVLEALRSEFNHDDSNNGTIGVIAMACVAISRLKRTC